MVPLLGPTWQPLGPPLRLNCNHGFNEIQGLRCDATHPRLGNAAETETHQILDHNVTIVVSTYGFVEIYRNLKTMIILLACFVFFGWFLMFSCYTCSFQSGTRTIGHPKSWSCSATCCDHEWLTITVAQTGGFSGS